MKERGVESMFNDGNNQANPASNNKDANTASATESKDKREGYPYNNQWQNNAWSNGQQQQQQPNNQWQNNRWQNPQWSNNQSPNGQLPNSQYMINGQYQNSQWSNNNQWQNNQWQNSQLPNGQWQQNNAPWQPNSQMQNIAASRKCSDNPCSNGARCIDQYPGYTCVCTGTWTGPNCDQCNKKLNTLPNAAFSFITGKQDNTFILSFI